MDFGLLPPEINSGRMYAGPGAAPMLAAAAAWGGLADQLHSAAAAYESVLADLTAQWRGPSAARMFGALEPYRAWTAATAGRAEATAAQAMAAVSAYEDAFSATVPPPVIAANRTQLAALVATNFFGQHTPAIMATELHYAEMWAQDAVAMYGYAGRVASTLPTRPFDPPPDVARPASADPSLLSAVDAFLTGPFSPLELYKLPAVAELLAGQCYLLPRAAVNMLGALGKTALPAAGGELLTRGLVPSGTFAGPTAAGAIPASVGRAELIGALSVPRTWTSPTPPAPAIGAAAGSLPRGGPPALAAVIAADGQETMLANLAASSMAGQTPSRGHGAPAVGLGSLAGRDDTEQDLPAVSNIFVIPEDESPDCVAGQVR